MKKYYNDNDDFTTYVFVGFFVLLIFSRLLLGFTDPVGTERTLKNQGYSNVEITGWRPFSASESDVYATGFRANSPSGVIVTGVVTRGLVKGNTIRLD